METKTTAKEKIQGFWYRHGDEIFSGVCCTLIGAGLALMGFSVGVICTEATYRSILAEKDPELLGKVVTIMKEATDKK